MQHHTTTEKAHCMTCAEDAVIYVEIGPENSQIPSCVQCIKDYYPNCKPVYIAEIGRQTTFLINNN